MKVQLPMAHARYSMGRTEISQMPCAYPQDGRIHSLQRSQKCMRSPLHYPSCGIVQRAEIPLLIRAFQVT